MCKDCNEQKLFRFNVCKKCFYEKYCVFCRELTLKKECTGHQVTTPKNNRFSADEQFVNEVLMDFEQGT